MVLFLTLLFPLPLLEIFVRTLLRQSTAIQPVKDDLIVDS